ncbi:hypothetical protein ACFQL0_05555 [Haloplanus litoreus]|uniref:DUF7263 family protein n=1 Tax=Haloplanus litoreus TaxID=767515 RepID=UPI003609BC48
MRGQTNLIALAVALVLLTGATVVGVTLADSALAGADRDPVERHAATAVADRLTAADSRITVRANALNATAVDALNASRLSDLAPPRPRVTFALPSTERPSSNAAPRAVGRRFVVRSWFARDRPPSPRSSTSPAGRRSGSRGVSAAPASRSLPARTPRFGPSARTTASSCPTGRG